MSNLNTLYRPKFFNDVVGHKAIIKILMKQVETKEYSNCYLFCGPSGCGKTTLARIFANKINQDLGKPIEIDGASNNGVDNVRTIIESANERSLDSEYKIFIIDEAHMITTSGWNAFLKSIEEPPQYTIFIFCTTDPQKLPKTIPNRCQVFNLNRLNIFDITNRLESICTNEGILFNRDALENIAKYSNGNLRQAITYLNTCSTYGDVTEGNVNEVLGLVGYPVLLNFVNFIIDLDNNLVDLVEYVIERVDLNNFINELLNFTMELTKFCISKDITHTYLPEYLADDVKYATGVFQTQEENIAYFKKLTNKILNIKLEMKKAGSEYEIIFRAMVLDLIR